MNIINLTPIAKNMSIMINPAILVLLSNVQSAGLKEAPIKEPHKYVIIKRNK
jgi:hypothetical protein